MLVGSSKPHTRRTPSIAGIYERAGRSRGDHMRSREGVRHGAEVESGDHAATFAPIVLGGGAERVEGGALHSTFAVEHVVLNARGRHMELRRCLARRCRCGRTGRLTQRITLPHPLRRQAAATAAPYAAPTAAYRAHIR